MKALVYEKPGRKYSSIRDIPYPECGPDDVIIKVMSASICKGVEHDHDQEGVGTEGEYGGVNFGYLLYENNGQVTDTFQIRVPLTVTYDWGEIKTSYVDITVLPTKANKAARR